MVANGIMCFFMSSKYPLPSVGSLDPRPCKSSVNNQYEQVEIFAHLQVLDIPFVRIGCLLRPLLILGHRIEIDFIPALRCLRSGC